MLVPGRLQLLNKPRAQLLIFGPGDMLRNPVLSAQWQIKLVDAVPLVHGIPRRRGQLRRRQLCRSGDEGRDDEAEVLRVGVGAALQCSPSILPPVRRVCAEWRGARRAAERAGAAEGWAQHDELSELSEQLDAIREAYGDEEAEEEEEEGEEVAEREL